MDPQSILKTSMDSILEVLKKRFNKSKLITIDRMDITSVTEYFLRTLNQQRNSNCKGSSILMQISRIVKLKAPITEETLISTDQCITKHLQELSDLEVQEAKIFLTKLKNVSFILVKLF